MSQNREIPRGFLPNEIGDKIAMNKQDNTLLTGVKSDTIMGKFIRKFWVPVIRGDALERDGAPVRVTLFGDKFVAFRSTNGEVGILDEACPHRGVSLALGRNEENGLRCIFHGWKFDTHGKVIDAPCEPAESRERFCKNIRVNQYAVHETAGVVWAYVGGGEPPPFPEFEFNTLPPARVVIRRAIVPYNWVQAVEAHIDSSHVPFLHRGFLTKNRDRLDSLRAENLAAMMVDTSPTFDAQETAYGLREAALRNMGEGKTYARIREIVLPFFTFIPGPEVGPFGGRASVPIDDGSSAEWYILYHPDRDLTESDIKTVFGGSSDDPDNFAANMGTEESLWDQDRTAMREGHFSGLTKGLPFEDFIVQSSMGSNVDRSLEQLGSSDKIIIKVRRMLLEAARSYSDGKPAQWTSGFTYKSIQARSATFEAGLDWRDFASLNNAPPSKEAAKEETS